MQFLALDKVIILC